MPKKNEWPSDWKKVSVCMSRFTRKETRRNVEIIRKKVDAFEMWCCRRVMRVSWMERNQCMGSGNIKPERTLESRVAEAALRYFVVREEGGMENDVMLGEMSGKRSRGRPRTRWLDNVNNLK